MSSISLFVLTHLRLTFGHLLESLPHLKYARDFGYLKGLVHFMTIELLYNVYSEFRFRDVSQDLNLGFCLGIPKQGP